MEKSGGPEHGPVSFLDGNDLRQEILRDPGIARVLEALSGLGTGDLYLVGGALRDWCLGRKEFFDLDFVTAGDVGQVSREAADRLSARRVVLDERWGVVRLVCPLQGPGTKRVTLDFAAMQGGDILEDLKRRDFTCNAMALPLAVRNGEDLRQGWVDPQGGLGDIRTRTLRMVGPDAFREDPLRMLRAFRLGASLGFRIHAQTLACVVEHRERIRESAGERIHEEWMRLFASSGSFETLVTMDRSGLLQVLFPEIEGLRGLAQGTYHRLDGWGHSLETFRLMERSLDTGIWIPARWSEAANSWVSRDPKTRPLLLTAALFHDLGKAGALTRDPQGEIHFYGHERKGAEIVALLMDRFRCGRTERERLRTWVRYHMGPLHMTQADRRGTLTEKAKIRFLRRVGPDALGVLLLSLADTGARGGGGPGEDWNRSYRELMDSLFSLCVERGAVSPDVRPPVSGADLMEALEISPGPRVGRLLRLVAEAYIQGKIQDREEALALARRFHETLRWT